MSAGESARVPAVEPVFTLLGALMSTSAPEDFTYSPQPRPRLSVEESPAAKNIRSLRSPDDLAAETFESDEELEEFLAFTYSERHRDAA
ncbi:hypothetical protein ACWZEH_11075 [Streptomyces sp. QTS137]